MKNFLLAIVLMLVPTFAIASPHPFEASYGSGTWSRSEVQRNTHIRQKHNKNYRRQVVRRTASVTETHSIPRGSHNAGARPGRWCGWWMRTKFGGGPEYNLARNWAKRGSPTSPQVGAVVVWRSHVGYISGRASNGQWIVTSGNDGGKVRSRPRSIAGAIAFRTL